MRFISCLMGIALVISSSAFGQKSKFVQPTSPTGLYSNEIRKVNEQAVRQVSVDDRLQVLQTSRNHYKVKTWEEYQRIRKRGRADLPTDSDWKENIEHTFQIHNKNEIEDLTAKMFFNN